jgi:hypothetical protein
MNRSGSETLASVSLVRRAASGLSTVALSLTLLAGLVFAQESDPTAASSAKPSPVDPRADQVEGVESEPPDVPEKPRAADVDEKKRKKVVATLAAIAGVAVFGVGAIAVTMVWARRLRRMARDPGPRQTTVGNDFWFLKPEKVKITETSREDGQPTPQPPPSTESPE